MADRPPVERSFYRDRSIPKSARALWIVRFNDGPPVKARIGSGREPIVNDSTLLVENLSGWNLNVRDIAFMAFRRAGGWNHEWAQRSTNGTVQKFLRPYPAFPLSTQLSAFFGGATLRGAGGGVVFWRASSTTRWTKWSFFTAGFDRTKG